MKILISEPRHWQDLAQNGLSTVVDPLVLRCGELFLKGARGSCNPAKVWDLLIRNTHAVSMFFDSLILQEKIPVFNYGDTFDMQLNFDQRTLTAINQFEEVLFDVDVEYEEYHRIKNAALDELAKIYNDTEAARIKRSTAMDVIQEIYFSGHQWSPGLESLEARLTSEEEKQLARYLLGGLIFGGYAQEMGTEHLMQPKRSRIFAALAVQAKAANRTMEDEIFGELKKFARSPIEDIPWMPTFFPYLLDRVKSRDGLLEAVVELRRSPGVVEYRRWLNELIQDWRINGKIRQEKRRDVLKIKEDIERRLGPSPFMPTVEFKVNIAEVAAGKLPAPEVDQRKMITKYMLVRSGAYGKTVYHHRL